jgi:C4-dicarboxylate transporter DctQ subunit
MVSFLSNILNKFAEKAVIFLMTAISVIIFVQVVSRYVFNSSLTWSEEVGRYILIWITFLGASIGVKKYSHIGIDFIYEKISIKNKKILDFIIIFIGLVFSFIMFYYGFKLAYMVRFQKSSALLIPMTIPYLALPVSGLLIFIHYFDRLSNLFFKRQVN